VLRKASAAEEETKLDAQLYHQCNQSIHLLDGVTVQKYGFGSSTSAFAVSTQWQVSLVGWKHLLM
jgi:hypothetical protein